VVCAPSKRRSRYNVINSDICITQVLQHAVGGLLHFKFQLLVAVSLLGCAGTFFTVSDVNIGEQPQGAAQQQVRADDGWRSGLATFLRANLSLFAQTCVPLISCASSAAR
jgi:hypothetical protein